MSERLHQNTDTTKEQSAIKKPVPEPDTSVLESVQTIAPDALQRAVANPQSVKPNVMPAFQQTYGNQFVQRLSKRTGTAGRPPVLRRAGGDNGGGDVHPNVESEIAQKQGQGEALPDDTRQQMESGIGADFSGVQVHDDTQAHDLNRSLNARAFTTGQDIFFGEGEYNPASTGGQELIAHEMTHVVQQGGTPQTPQAKMTVNEPDDAYEQEADSVAEEVVHQPDEKQNTLSQQVMEMPLTQLARMTTTGSPAGSGLAIQRAEEEEAPSEEELQAEKEKKEKEAKEKGETDQSGDEKDKAGKDAEAEIEKTEQKAQEEATPIAAANETLAAAKQAATAVKPPTPMDAPTEEDLSPTFEEDALEEQQTEAIEQAAALQGTVDWAATKPPDWDLQVASQETFLALFDPEEGLMNDLTGAAAGESATGIELQLKAIQRQAGESGAGTTTATTSGEQDGSGGAQSGYKPSAIPGAPYELPTAGDSIGERIADAFIIDPVAGTSVDVANSFAAIGDEPNFLSGLAGVLEAIIKVMELVTNILGLVSMVLTLVGALLFALGWALIAAGTALMGVPFMQGVASAMVSAGGTMQGWGATLLSWAASINSFVFKLTVIRAELRVLALLIRGLSILAMLLNGASKEEIDRQLKLMQNQATGLAVDGITLGLTYGVGGGVPKSKPPSTFIQGGLGAAGKSVGIVIAANVLRTGGGVGKGYATEAMRKEDDTLENGEGQEVVLPPVPWDAVVMTDSSAATMAGIEGEQQELELRLAIIDDALRVKENWGEAMAGVNTRAGENRQHLAKSQEILQQRAGLAEQYSEQTQDLGKEAKGLEASSGDTANALQDEKEHIKTGASQAQSQGKSDPAMREGEGAADDAGQAPKAAGDIDNAATQESNVGKKAAAEAKDMIGQAQETDTMTEDLQTRLTDKSAQNKEEIENMMAEREALLARLEELTASEDEQKAQQEQGRQEAETWVGESQSIIEENKVQALGEEGAAEFDAETAEGAEEIGAAEAEAETGETEEAA